MEYIIYCDESVSDGKYYTDFFGGVLVRNTDYDTIKAALDAKKVDLNLNGEIKWVKVTSNYLNKYKQVMDLFFSFLKDSRLKVRIMFRETAQMPTGLSPEKIHNRYSLLYYQFVKHAFGLTYHDGPKPIFLRLYFDEIPYPLDQRDAFKSHIISLQQCMDIVLGSISFMFNNKNEEIPVGFKERGHRTVAKEQLFFHILKHIQACDNIELFDISNTTPIAVPKDFWGMPYRHWKFTTPEFRNEHKKSPA